MASATISNKQYTVNLTLNEHEVEVLLKITEHVGGNPNGPRGAVDRIRNALRGLGVDASDTLEADGSIYF